MGTLTRANYQRPGDASMTQINEDSRDVGVVSNQVVGCCLRSRHSILPLSGKTAPRQR